MLMHKRIINPVRCLVLAGGFLAAAMAGHAQEPAPVALSTNNCVISFETKSTWGIIKGEVRQVSGWARVSRQDAVTSLQAQVEVNVTDLTTNSGGRDAKLRTFCLQGDQFPKIMFMIERCNMFQGGLMTISGNLTIRDVTRPLVLGTKYSASASEYRFAGAGELKWNEFGVCDPSTVLSKVQPKTLVSFELTLPRN
jgi:polyisoprenoid-binding protein YceI